MASNVIPFPVPAPQPGLRSFIIFDHIPAGCFVHEVVGNDNRDHIRHGEFVIIDPNDLAPQQGELFLIQWSNGNRAIVECELFTRPAKYPQPTEPRWWVSPTRPQIVANLDGSEYMRVRFKDGPWPTVPLTEKLRGKVVGIYQPDFRNQFARLSA